MKVHVLVIDAENAGNLISAHATEELAKAEAVKFAKENWEEDVHGGMPENDDEVLGIYFDPDSAEDFFQIEECEVEGAVGCIW